MNTSHFLPFASPWITDSERQAVWEVLEGNILTHGPQSSAFEQEFGAFMGGEAYCVSVSSCMAALHLAYLEMGIGPGDEVIVTAQTHVATVNAVELLGARPVFADCEPITGNINPDVLEALITPFTKAIGLVHFVGIPCEMDAIMDVANKHDLAVIEDCALALGARYKKKHVGLFGRAGCFSFYPAKHITTGDGGMFVTCHKEIADKVAIMRSFGVDRTFTDRTLPGIYDVIELGLNYRMSDINAALGRRQLSRIGKILECRRSNFTKLKEYLAGINDVSILDSPSDHLSSSHYCLVVILDGYLTAFRDKLIRRLNEAKIGTSVYYPHPVPRMMYYRQKYDYRAEDFPYANKISDHSIALPVGPHLGSEDMKYIGETFIKSIKEIKL